MRARPRGRTLARARAPRLDPTDRTDDDDDDARRRAPPIPRPDRRVESHRATRLDARAMTMTRVSTRRGAAGRMDG